MRKLIPRKDRVHSSFCLIWVFLSNRHSYKIQWSWVNQVSSLPGHKFRHPAPHHPRHNTERKQSFRAWATACSISFQKHLPSRDHEVGMWIPAPSPSSGSAVLSKYTHFVIMSGIVEIKILWFGVVWYGMVCGEVWCVVWCCMVCGEGSYVERWYVVWCAVWCVVRCMVWRIVWYGVVCGMV